MGQSTSDRAIGDRPATGVPGRIESELGQRLYGSFICCDLGFGRHSVESLGEDTRTWGKAL